MYEVCSTVYKIQYFHKNRKPLCFLITWYMKCNELNNNTYLFVFFAFFLCTNKSRHCSTCLLQVHTCLVSFLYLVIENVKWFYKWLYGVMKVCAVMIDIKLWFTFYFNCHFAFYYTFYCTRFSVINLSLIQRCCHN